MRYVNFFLVAIVFIAVVLGAGTTGKLSEGYYPGELIPDMTLNDVEGNEIDLGHFKGKKIVVNFWAAYDASSRATNVMLNNYLKSNNPDVVFLSVSFDASRSVFEKTILWDNMEQGLHFCDTDGAESRLFKEFKLKKGFKNYLIDENGVIMAINLTPETLKTML